MAKQVKPLADSNAVGSSFGEVIKALSEMVKQAYLKAPGWMVLLILIVGVGALAGISVGLAFIFSKQPGFGLIVVLSLVVFLVVVLYLFTGVLRDWWKFKSGVFVVKDKSPESCDISGTEMKSICEKVRKQGPQADLLLHSFCCPKPEPSGISKLNEYSIYHLWADPRGSSIKATIGNFEGRDCLEVIFDNVEGWASNITIRPAGLHPYRVEESQRYLRFDVMNPAPIRKGNLDPVSMALRIYDKRCTQWIWGPSKSDVRTCEVHSKEGWKVISIDLKADPWCCFDADANHMYSGQAPEFSQMILALVMELGSPIKNREPGLGKGRILISNIRLES